MRKILAGISILLVLCACGNRNAQIDATEEAFTGETDPDTLIQEMPEQENEEEEEVVWTDGSFESFVHNFVSYENFQLRRIKFPLPYYLPDTVIRIEKQEWEFEKFFIDNDYYTLLFDNEEELDSIENDSLTSIQVEWFYLADRQVKRYYFEKINDIWKLEALNLRDMVDTGHEEFIDFYRQFATDSLFQARHIRIPLQFAMIDPDDGFSLLESTIDLEQWYAFKPDLPVDRLFNISYGQHNEDTSRTKILTFKGNNNQLSVHLYFRRHRGTWELYKFEDSTM